jgi:hypothetical protein
MVDVDRDPNPPFQPQNATSPSQVAMIGVMQAQQLMLSASHAA